MGLELMPDGKTFKKLNAVQEKALKRYYRRSRDKPWQETLGLPILAGGVVITGAIGAIAYIFRDQIKTTFEESKEEFFEWIFSLPKKGAVAAGGGVADAIVNVGDALFGPEGTLALFTGKGLDEPINKEYILLNPQDSIRDYRYAGPFSRCERWALDADDWLARDQANDYLTKIGHALTLKGIIKNMKGEDCPRPAALTVAQWED